MSDGEPPPLDAQKEYIEKYGPKLGPSVYKSILMMVLNEGNRDNVVDTGDSVLVLLDRLEPVLITNVYRLIHTTVEKQFA